jgi:hypothetical protein
MAKELSSPDKLFFWLHALRSRGMGPSEIARAAKVTETDFPSLDGVGIEHLHGHGEAVDWGRKLVQDIRDYKAGGGSWMRYIPQNNECAAAPDLLHPERWIRIPCVAAQDVAIELKSDVHVVNQKHNVVKCKQCEGYVTMRRHIGVLEWSGDGLWNATTT